MTLYLDCEFNGHNGPLLSMALVSDRDGSSFYEEIMFDGIYEPWVNENVVPLFDGHPIAPHIFRAKLCLYLNQHIGESIVADWPHDFTLLMNMMCGDNYGQSFMMPCTMHLIKSGSFLPDTPHHALSDARALMNWCMMNKLSFPSRESPLQ